jgi:hypothetical protein
MYVLTELRAFDYALVWRELLTGTSGKHRTGNIGRETWDGGQIETWKSGDRR